MPSTPPKSGAPYIRLIVNGHLAEDEGLLQAIDTVRRTGARLETSETHEDDDIAEVAARAVHDGAGIVAAAGGDGTLGDVVNGVLSKSAPECAVGLIPMGTGNDFAAAAKIEEGEPLAALKLISRGSARRIDVGQLGDTYFINMATGGFGAEVTAQTPGELKDLLGRWAYVVTGLSQIKNLTPNRVRVEATGLSWKGAAYTVAVGNGRQAGGGFQLCPRARFDDGLLDVMIIPEMPLLELPSLFSELRKDSDALLSPDEIVYRQVESVTVESDEDIQFNLDGTPCTAKSFRFDVVPGALPFILP
jgi:lipid kinase YegS